MSSVYNQGMTQMLPQMSQMPNNVYPFQNSTDVYMQRLTNMAQQFAPPQNGFNTGVQSNLTQGGMNGMVASQVATQGYSVRAVTGYEEAMASQIPFDGTITIFVDKPHKRIYTKQLNVEDGTALMKTFAQTENPKPVSEKVENSVEYVEKSEFDKLKARFDDLMLALTPDSNKNESKSKNEKKENK